MASTARTWVVLLALLGTGACGRNEAPAGLPERTGEVSVADARLAPDVPGLMNAARVPGLAVATLRNCDVASVEHHGVADVGTGAPVTAATLFEAASLTKTLFAFIVLQLVDEGVVDLDAPIAETLAYPRITDQASYGRLTPRLVLEHRSGLPNWASDPLDPETWGDIPFKNAPDTEFGYSGEGYQLLQALVEEATGKTLDVLFAERLGPVMPHTSLAAAKAGAARAFGHDENGGSEEGRAMIEAPRAVAASSALTTVADYAGFLELLCAGGGLSADARAEMLRPQSPTSAPEVSWALGWGTQESGGERLYFHWGDNGPFKAFTAFNPATGDGVVYFANAHGGLQLIEGLASPVVGDLAPVIGWLGYGRVDTSE